MKKFLAAFITFLFFASPALTYANFPNWNPIAFTASNVTLDNSTNSVTFTVNPADFSGFPTRMHERWLRARFRAAPQKPHRVCHGAIALLDRWQLVAGDAATSVEGKP